MRRAGGLVVLTLAVASGFGQAQPAPRAVPAASARLAVIGDYGKAGPAEAAVAALVLGLSERIYFPRFRRGPSVSAC